MPLLAHIYDELLFPFQKTAQMPSPSGYLPYNTLSKEIVSFSYPTTVPYTIGYNSDSYVLSSCHEQWIGEYWPIAPRRNTGLGS